MGDLTQEIGDLLGEDSPPETSDETRGTEKSTETAESGESGGENQSQGQEAEASEAESEGEQSESEGTQEEEVESETEDSEDDPKDAQIRQLQEEVNRLSKGEAKSPESESSSETETSQEEKSEPFDPFMGQDFDSIIESKESFQQWAQGFYEKAKKDAHEEVLKRLPETVNSYVKQQVATQKAVDDFYSQNDDLANYKNYVGQIANEVQAEHSDWTFEQILEETATRARKTLGLKEKAKGKGQGGSQQKKPALAGGNKAGSSKARSSSSGDELSDVEKGIQELLPENE